MKKIITAVLMSIMALSAIGQQHLDKYFIPANSCGDVDLHQDSIHQHLYSGFDDEGVYYNDYYINVKDTVFHFSQLSLYRHIEQQSNLFGNPSCVIQQFYTDTAITIQGIAAYIINKFTYNYNYPGCTFELRDSSPNVIDSVRWDTIPNFYNYNTGGAWYEFMFAQTHTVQGMFGTGFSTEFAVMNAGIPGPSTALLGCKTSSYTSPYPILAIWEDSILPVSASWATSDDLHDGGGEGNLVCYATMFLFPILAEDTIPTTDTIPDSSSLKPNVMVERYSQIYPNPAQSEITVTCSFAMESIELYNPEGQRVLSRQANKAHTLAIDVSTLSKGIYLCKIKTAKGCATKKVIVQ